MPPSASRADILASRASTLPKLLLHQRPDPPEVHLACMLLFEPRHDLAHVLHGRSAGRRDGLGDGLGRLLLAEALRQVALDDRYLLGLLGRQLGPAALLIGLDAVA